MKAMTFYPVEGIGAIERGADVAAAIVAALENAGETFLDGDICVIAHKIVSKAQGRLVDLRTVTAGTQARRLAQITGKPAELLELMLHESEQLTVNARGAAICRHKLGWVCANAAIDLSNASEEGQAVLLPADPDASAREISQRIQTMCGKRVAVIISDSHGRPLRDGITGVTVGCWGIDPIRSYVGCVDLAGRTMHVSLEAVADELAGGASLLMGQANEGIPAVLVRGYAYTFALCGSQQLKREAAREIFQPVGTTEQVEI